MTIMIEPEELKIIRHYRKQSILKKFKQQSLKQLTIDTIDRLTFYHLTIFSLLIHHFSDFRCLH